MQGWREATEKEQNGVSELWNHKEKTGKGKKHECGDSDRIKKRQGKVSTL